MHVVRCQRDMSITTWWQRSTTLVVLTASGSSQTLHYISLLVHIYVSHVSLSLNLGLRKASFRKDAQNYLTVDRYIVALNDAGTFQGASEVTTYERTSKSHLNVKKGSSYLTLRSVIISSINHSHVSSFHSYKVVEYHDQQVSNIESLEWTKFDVMNVKDTVCIDGHSSTKNKRSLIRHSQSWLRK